MLFDKALIKRLVTNFLFPNFESNLETGQCYSMRHSLNVSTLTFYLLILRAKFSNRAMLFDEALIKRFDTYFLFADFESKI